MRDLVNQYRSDPQYSVLRPHSGPTSYFINLFLADLLAFTQSGHFTVRVLQEVVVPVIVLQHVLGGVHVLFGVHRGIFLQGAIEPAPGPDQIADVVEVTLVLIVAPPREVSILR